MTRKTWLLFAILPAMMLAAGCNGDDDDGGGGDGGVIENAVVSVTGNAGVQVGDTLQLSASTENGTDNSYTWTSSDPGIATVDDTGLVTGVAAGDAVITAEGDDSGASDSQAIVVFAEDTGGGNPVPEITQAWSESGHADTEAEAFQHWAEEGNVVPTSCAKCHSTTGFRDYAGADGSAEYQVDAEGVGGEGITCSACHSAIGNLDQVPFPSGAILENSGPTVTCWSCHQGRESTDSVDATIAEAGVGDDEVIPEGSFQNIHYFAAAATLNGTLVRGGYQYAGEMYDARFQHAADLNECTSCHNPHSLEVKLADCSGCHTNVPADGATIEDVYDIRMASSAAFDYDGDGNTTEGIYYEVEGMREVLLPAIQQYATDNANTSDICYSDANYPYFFVDTNGDGTCGDDEAVFPNAYDTWTPQLLKAAYNYQYSGKDPGGFAHNAKYVIELLYDSMAAMGIDMTPYVRGDFGHFNGSAEPFRHWDEYANEDGTGLFVGEVEGACSKCHGSDVGFTNYLAGYNPDAPVADFDEETLPPVPADMVNGLECTVCHENASDFTTRSIASFRFANGVVITDYDPTANICATCHSGREAQATVDSYFAEEGPAFRNVHYKPAAGSLFGAEGDVGYEFAGQAYVGRFTHTGGDSNLCTFCHPAVNTQHTFLPADIIDTCAGCHTGATELADIRFGAPDVNGNGDSSESMQAELDSLAADLLTAMQAYASTTVGTAICYAEDSYPYWFVDTDGSGDCSEDEASFANQYRAWDEPLAQSAYNFQFYTKDPGAWAHNYDYHAELLIDSIGNVGGAVDGYNRPAP